MIECFFQHRKTGKLYGLGTTVDCTIMELDDMMREDLGYPPDDFEFLGGWAKGTSITYMISLNSTEDAIDEAVREHMEAFPNAPLQKVWDYLKTNFRISNSYRRNSNWNK